MKPKRSTQLPLVGSLALLGPCRAEPLVGVALLVLASAGSSGCVTKVRYDKLVAESAQAKTDADAKQKDADARVQALQAQIAAAETAAQDREGRVSDLTTQNHNVQASLDEQTAMNEQLRGELGRLGKDVDKILADKGTLSKALDDAKQRLEELRKAQAASEARVSLFKDFERRFKPLIDAGQISVGTRRGMLEIAVPGDVLFDQGRSEVRSAAQGRAHGSGPLAPALHHDATARLSAPGAAAALPATAASATPAAVRRYLVTASVDSAAEPPAESPAPAQTKSKPHGPTARAPEARLSGARPHHTPSSWELSAGQAGAVGEYLVSLGVPSQSLVPAGAGSFDPIAPGDDAGARMKNRRVEIALLPDGQQP